MNERVGEYRISLRLGLGVECFPSFLEALGLIPNTLKRKTKNKKPLIPSPPL